MVENENGRDKRENYHCHLSQEEKNYFSDGKCHDNKLGRTSNTKFGIPNKTTTYNEGKIEYDYETKTWKCKLRNFKRNKFNRKQVMNHANSKHNANNNNNCRNNIIKNTKTKKR